ncbi:MAG: BMP family ABC transporter substrate-binding protein, partial [Saccharofermentans sp.]|nr:BMP family ABC transporter substrate-binding protein [Saccharofermentans sp.]
MSKRIIAVFMLASMLLSLAACNGSGLLPSKESTSETTSVTEEPSSSETTESEQEPTTEETTAS